MHHATFAAWCRRDGRYKTVKHPFRDWNDDLLKPVKVTVDEEFPKLNSEIGHCKERILATLLDLLAGIEQDLKGMTVMFSTVDAVDSQCSPCKYS